MTSMLRKRSKGFTLIELMIVVAIIGILAAIAIPNFLRFQLKSKTSEGKVNLAAIRTAEESYISEFGLYVPAAVEPTAAPTTQKQDWLAPSTSGFNVIGWSPEGQVFFQYAVGTDAANVAYFATALADIDGNAVNQVWGYQQPAGAVNAAPVHACGAAPAGLKSIKQVGPCDGGTAAPVFGQSVF